MMPRFLLVPALLTIALTGAACGDDDEPPNEDPGPPSEGEPCLVGGEPCDGALFCAADGCFENTSGTCIVVPSDCEDEPTAPVCGCDDMMYPNRCEAHMTRRNVQFSGPCPD